MVVTFLLLPAVTYAFLYKETEIKIQGTITEMYDDNITFDKEDKKEDFLTRLGIMLSIMKEGKRRSLNFSLNINRGFYKKYNEIKDSAEDISVNFLNEFSEYDRIVISNIYSHTEYPITFEEEFGRVSERYSLYGNSFMINYSKDISEHFLVSTAYTNSRYWSSEENSVKSYYHILNIKLDYIHDIDSILFFTYNGSRANYENGDSISNHIIAIGIRQYLTKRLFFDGKIGANYLSTFGFTRNFINGTLIDNIDQRTTVRLSFTRQDQLVSNRRDIFSNWRIRGTVIRPLLEKMSSSFSLFYGQGKFKIADTINRLFGINSRISYEFNKYLIGYIVYNYSNFSSNIETRGYTRNTVVWGISMSF